ncbi:hypothetical protein KJS94_04790 [Flavihumibacter rivuli]|uniref:hypothetical protein n=1 Tax=Flavihumibacter rivuli TaxID=2838156 RepID=UPI001BDF001F|nr:hypothetical protein [Flavihumibacter rivuli]ULQ57515.1 hypothetical protein KJS94_04790 [Flavihumibacter rivuli]
MNNIEKPFKTPAEISVWQLTTRLVILAGILMAYSYCFMLTVESVLKLASS